MKRKWTTAGAGCLFAVMSISAQEAATAPPESMVVENVPGIPASLAESVGRYTENRSAFQTDWHPTRREMIIGMRFGYIAKAPPTKKPGGERQQVTLLPATSCAD